MSYKAEGQIKVFASKNGMDSSSSQIALCRQMYTAVGTVSTVRQDLLKKPSSFPGQFSDKYSVVDEMIK